MRLKTTCLNFTATKELMDIKLAVIIIYLIHVLEINGAPFRPYDDPALSPFPLFATRINPFAPVTVKKFFSFAKLKFQLPRFLKSDTSSTEQSQLNDVSAHMSTGSTSTQNPRANSNQLHDTTEYSTKSIHSSATLSLVTSGNAPMRNSTDSLSVGSKELSSSSISPPSTLKAKTQTTTLPPTTPSVVAGKGKLLVPLIKPLPTISIIPKLKGPILPL